MIKQYQIPFLSRKIQNHACMIYLMANRYRDIREQTYSRSSEVTQKTRYTQTWPALIEPIWRWGALTTLADVSTALLPPPLRHYTSWVTTLTSLTRVHTEPRVVGAFRHRLLSIYHIWSLHDSFTFVSYLPGIANYSVPFLSWKFSSLPRS